MKKYTINFIFLTFILTIFTSCGSDSSKLSTFNDSATIYEDAEDGSTDRWRVLSGYPITNVNIGANDSERSIFVRENWYKDDNGNSINGADYELSMYNNHQFILEFDKMKLSEQIKHCFTVGVKTNTTYGERYISFNTFYDKEGMDPDSQWILDDSIKELVFPLSMDYVTVAGVWKHLRFDLVKYLHQLEPNNDIIEITAFYFEGGNDYLDNIQLSSR